jgi:hypothetical protein
MPAALMHAAGADILAAGVWGKWGALVSASVQQMADRVSELLEERLRVRGKSLPDKLRRGGRQLPRKVRSAAEYLAMASVQARVPRLMMQLDHRQIAESYDLCLGYLRPLGAGARRKAAVMSFLTTAAAVVLVTGVLFLAVLVWRGYV